MKRTASYPRPCPCHDSKPCVVLLVMWARAKRLRCFWMVSGVLEYRGYDSAGVALLNGNGLEIRKTIGRTADLCKSNRRESGPRTPRNQPHPLSNPRRSHRRQRPPPPRQSPASSRARAQRRDRELPGASGSSSSIGGEHIRSQTVPRCTGDHRRSAIRR